MSAEGGYGLGETPVEGDGGARSASERRGESRGNSQLLKVHSIVPRREATHWSLHASVLA